MRGKTWQLAALAAGSMARPNGDGDRPLMHRRQYDNSTTTETPSPYPSTSSLDITRTMYTTVNATVTVCSESSSLYPFSTSTGSSTTSSSSTASSPDTGSSSQSATSSSSVTASSTSTSSSSSTSTNSSSSSSSVSSTSSSSTSSITTLTSSTSVTPTSLPPAYSWSPGELQPEYVGQAVKTSASSLPECTLLPTSPLTNAEQVGNSIWGTLCAPYYPQWLGESTSPPWGDNRTVTTSDATIKNDIPITNVTRYYEFTVSRGRISADGVLRDVITINNQFPGPLIEANWGDWIEVIVHNNISDPFEGTALHWHGQLLRSTPWEDGVPSAGQCPIAPGHSFTYRYQAELHGTSWYHAHYSAQFTAGVAGPMIVHGPSSLPYDIDVGPVMLSDWYHIPYFSIVADAVGTNFSEIPPVSDSVLINGRGQFDCSKASYDDSTEWLGSNLASNITWTCVEDAPFSAFRFQSGKVHRLRLVNHGANGVQKFSIDHHNLTVIATDYVPTVPYDVEVVTLGVGQRADVLVTGATDPKASIWMRAHAPGGEPCGGSNQVETLAAIYYEDADTTVAPTSTSDIDNQSCVNDALNMTTPSHAITPSTNHWKQDLTLTLELNETGSFEFRINHETYHANYNNPLLEQVQQGNFTFDPKWQVYNFFENTSIILNITNDMPLTHPFHLHGHNFYILNIGDNTTAGSNANSEKRQAGPRFLPGATWDGSVINAANPMRRDTVLIPPYGFAALQFELDNPGVWPFHCHVAWHLSGGQGMTIIYKTDEISELPEGFTDQTCKDWDWYAANNGPVDQIDSGA